MQKRLFGILASIAVIAAACGGATTSSAPPAGSAAPGASATAAASPAPSGADLAAEQILTIDLGSEPPTLDPNKAQDSTSIAVLHALHRGLVYFDKDLKVVPALAEALPEVSADAKTLTFTLKDGIKYSNGDPIVAGDFVYSMEAHSSTRGLRPRTRYVMCRGRGRHGAARRLAGADPAADRRRRSTPLLDEGRRRGARRQDLRRHPRHAGDLLHQRRWPCGSPSRSRRSGSPARTRPRPRTTSAPARSSWTPGTTTARSSSSRTRTGPARPSRP